MAVARFIQTQIYHFKKILRKAMLFLFELQKT